VDPLFVVAAGTRGADPTVADAANAGSGIGAGSIPPADVVVCPGVVPRAEFGAGVNVTVSVDPDIPIPGPNAIAAIGLNPA